MILLLVGVPTVDESRLSRPDYASGSSSRRTVRHDPKQAPSSVLADEAKFVSVRVLHGELARAVRGVEQRLDYFGTVAELLRPGIHITDTEVVSPAAGTGSISEIANWAEPVGKWAYVGALGGQWPCAGSSRIDSYQATARPKSLTLTLTCSSRGESTDSTIQPTGPGTEADR